MRRTSNGPRRLGEAALLVFAATILACGQRSQTANTGSSAGKGQAGVYSLITASRLVEGAVTSTDGQLNCGPADSAVNACGRARYAWTATGTAGGTSTPGAQLGGFSTSATCSLACHYPRGAPAPVQPATWSTTGPLSCTSCHSPPAGPSAGRQQVLRRGADATTARTPPVLLGWTDRVNGDWHSVRSSSSGTLGPCSQRQSGWGLSALGRRIGVR